jgi:hypothetical protein
LCVYGPCPKPKKKFKKIKTLILFKITIALITSLNQIPGFHCQPTLADL